MKKLSVAALAGVMLAVCSSAQAADVTVSVTGTVKDNTCTVSGRGIILVDMGHATNVRDMQSVGDTGGIVPFTLKLEKCGVAASGVAVTFNGAADANNPDVLQLQSLPESATGIGVQLLDQNKTPLKLTTPSPVFALQTSSQEADLTLYARYIATTTGATAGRAWAGATVNFTYQ
ncbi:fimbrial protein [Klebsiella sp. CN_Kp098]|uniref:fimbrial protein n=1 Tax=unclassified Klebsiella TaxID=2608929 RepID=UPI0032B4DD64